MVIKMNSLNYNPEEFPVYKFKHQLPMFKFIQKLEKYNIEYEINNNLVSVFYPRHSLIGETYTLEQTYQWYINTFAPKRFARLRKVLNRIGNMFPNGIKWKYVVPLVIFFIFFAGIRIGFDQFKELSFVDKLKFASHPVEFTSTKIEEYIPEVNFDEIVPKIKLDEIKAIETTITTFNPKTESAEFIDKLLKNDKQQENISEEIKTPEQDGVGSFTIVFGVLIFLLLLMVGVLSFMYKDTISGLGKLANIRFKI